MQIHWLRPYRRFLIMMELAANLLRLGIVRIYGLRKSWDRNCLVWSINWDTLSTSTLSTIDLGEYIELTVSLISKSFDVGVGVMIYITLIKSPHCILSLWIKHGWFTSSSFIRLIHAFLHVRLNDGSWGIILRLVIMLQGLIVLNRGSLSGELADKLPWLSSASRLLIIIRLLLILFFLKSRWLHLADVIWHFLMLFRHFLFHFCFLDVSEAKKGWIPHVVSEVGPLCNLLLCAVQ